jgi:UPF0755 protein
MIARTNNKFLCVFLLIFLVLCSWYVLSFLFFLKTPLINNDKSEQKPFSFVFIQGMSAKNAAFILKKNNLITHTSFFIILARFKFVEHSLRAGEYLITPGMKPAELLEKMVLGAAVRHAFTIVEGWTFAQIVSSINSNVYIKHTIGNLNIDEMMAKLGHAGELPEGKFAPDTYLFSGEVTDVYLLNRAYQLMQKRLQDAWNNRSSTAWYKCPYEALIVASIIEKETSVTQEKPIISGVIARRIDKNMALSVCPTVIYAMGQNYKGKLSKKDLSINSPYNTYTHKGLPPTPISMPGMVSIKAALHPKEGTELYYVSKRDGTHKFSDTMKEHSLAIKKYLRN